MPQSLSSVLIHLVFSTKNREPFISPAVEAELHPYMATIFRDHDSPSLIIDGRQTMFTCYSRLAEQSRSLTSSRK
jgi:hypothetical protein